MKISDVKYIVLHCSATPPSQDIGAAEIDQWHRARGWSGIGYHWVIRRDGRIEPGRSVSHEGVQQGAHVRGHNQHSVGVCLVGGMTDEDRPANLWMETYTPQQMSAARELVDVLRRMFPGAEVLGHRDLSPDLDGDGQVERHEWVKECPCFDVRGLFG